ncbi:hypothetical protein ECG_02435 [Echinococcus granulosus]|uniref:Expressed protein n=1 Tax=Echinococcus granulosus TaxID=6210 RepID=A0A068WZU5_ECHGR|nr:hypothetical protein ECG_02435 [Echinococcus granulosus]CDS23217.1 expressed protein [Echinococcus granulosus]
MISYLILDGDSQDPDRVTCLTLGDQYEDRIFFPPLRHRGHLISTMSSAVSQQCNNFNVCHGSSAFPCMKPICRKPCYSVDTKPLKCITCHKVETCPDPVGPGGTKGNTLTPNSPHDSKDPFDPCTDCGVQRFDRWTRQPK